MKTILKYAPSVVLLFLFFFSALASLSIPSKVSAQAGDYLNAVPRCIPGGSWIVDLDWFINGADRYNLKQTSPTSVDLAGNNFFEYFQTTFRHDPVPLNSTIDYMVEGSNFTLVILNSVGTTVGPLDPNDCTANIDVDARDAVSGADLSSIVTWSIAPEGLSATSNVARPGDGGTVYSIFVTASPGYSLNSVSNCVGSAGSFSNCQSGNSTLVGLQESKVFRLFFDPTGSAPATPSSFTGASACYGGIAGIQLDWSVSAGATSYVIERSDGQVISFGSSITSWRDTSVSSGTTYIYMIRAENNFGQSALSAPVTVTTCRSIIGVCYVVPGGFPGAVTWTFNPGGQLDSISNPPPPGPSGCSGSALPAWQEYVLFPDTAELAQGYMLADITPFTIPGYDFYVEVWNCGAFPYCNGTIFSYNEPLNTVGGAQVQPDSNARFVIHYIGPGGPPSAPTVAPVATLVCAPSSPPASPQISITWNTVAGAAGYKLFRNGAFLIDKNTATSHSDVSVSYGSSYSYTYVAYNGIGDSSQSPVSNTVVATCDATINVSANVAGGSWTINGSASPGNGSGLGSSHVVRPATGVGSVFTITVTPPVNYAVSSITAQPGNITVNNQTTHQTTVSAGSSNGAFSIAFTVLVPPTVNLSANPPGPINQGASTNLIWSSTNATSCSAIWTPSTSPAGSQLVTPPATTTYNITCTGPGGNAPASVQVQVNGSAAISVTTNRTTTYTLTDIGSQNINAAATNNHAVFPPSPGGKLYTLTPATIVNEDFQVTYVLNSASNSCPQNQPCTILVTGGDDLDYTMTYEASLGAPTFISVVSSICGQVDIVFRDNSTQEDEFILYRDNDNNFGNGATALSPTIPSTTKATTGTQYSYIDADASLGLGGSFYYHIVARRASDGATSLQSTSGLINVAACPPNVVANVRIVDIYRNGLTIPYVAGTTRVLNGDILNLEVSIANLQIADAENVINNSTLTNNFRMVDNNNTVVPNGGSAPAVTFVTSGGSQNMSYDYNNFSLRVPTSGALPGTLSNEQWFLRFKALVQSTKTGPFDRININGVIDYQYGGSSQPGVTYNLGYVIIHLQTPGPVKYEEQAPQ